MSEIHESRGRHGGDVGPARLAGGAEHLPRGLPAFERGFGGHGGDGPREGCEEHVDTPVDRQDGRVGQEGLGIG